METLLSIRGRVMSGKVLPVKSPVSCRVALAPRSPSSSVHVTSLLIPQRDISTFENVAFYPYNTGQLPSNFIKEVQNTPTASADKY